MIAMGQPFQTYMRGWRGNVNCAHLVGDDPEELHAMAAALGLKREWFQEHDRLPHYDLIGSTVMAKARRKKIPVVEGREEVRLARACAEALKATGQSSRVRGERERWRARTTTAGRTSRRV